MNSRARGQLGEDIAAQLLEKDGCAVIARNHHSIYGEIDLIASDGIYIIFAEVKLRRPGAVVSPPESVTPLKKSRIIKTALLYLQDHPCDLQPRFDVISIVMDGVRLISLEHLKGAFFADGY